MSLKVYLFYTFKLMGANQGCFLGGFTLDSLLTVRRFVFDPHASSGVHKV
jgi:hypothetical protein